MTVRFVHPVTVLEADVERYGLPILEKPILSKHRFEFFFGVTVSVLGHHFFLFFHAISSGPIFKNQAYINPSLRKATLNI
jgi:hypothetical protein